MGLVLWIDQNAFVTDLLERVYKKKELPFYTLNSAEDFTYLVDDLKPEVIVLDSETAVRYQEALEKQYQASAALSEVPVIYLGNKDNLGFVPKLLGEIQRPFNPFDVPTQIEAMYKRLT